MRVSACQHVCVCVFLFHTLQGREWEKDTASLLTTCTLSEPESAKGKCDCVELKVTDSSKTSHKSAFCRERVCFMAYFGGLVASGLHQQYHSVPDATLHALTFPKLHNLSVHPVPLWFWCLILFWCTGNFSKGPCVVLLYFVVDDFVVVWNLHTTLKKQGCFSVLCSFVEWCWGISRLQLVEKNIYNSPSCSTSNLYTHKQLEFTKTF